MKLWLFGGLVWAGAIGGILYFIPKDAPEAIPILPPAVVATPAREPSTEVVEVLDLNPLLDPPSLPVAETEATTPRLSPVTGLIESGVRHEPIPLAVE